MNFKKFLQCPLKVLLTIATCLVVANLLMTNVFPAQLWIQHSVFYLKSLTTKQATTLFKIDRNRTQESLPPTILITAYQHSGSSIVASLLANDEKSVYFYEPVDAMYRATFGFEPWVLHIDLNFHFNGSVRSLCPREKDTIVDNILKITECNFNSLYHQVCSIDILKTKIHLKKKCGLRSCMPHQKFSLDVLQSLCSSPANHTTKCALKKYEPTMGKYAKDCEDVNFFTLKVMRYEMGLILNILQNSPQMFMIHLLRDPRGIINSFIRRNIIRVDARSQPYFMQKGFSKIDVGVKILAAKMCNLMRHNLKLIETHPELHNRIQIIYYEDFASMPTEFTKNLYRLFSLNVPTSVWSWLKQTTGAKKNVGKYVRQNSTETANLWRTELSQKHLEIIDSQCSSLYKHFR